MQCLDTLADTVTVQVCYCVNLQVSAITNDLLHCVSEKNVILLIFVK